MSFLDRMAAKGEGGKICSAEHRQETAAILREMVTLLSIIHPKAPAIMPAARMYALVTELQAAYALIELLDQRLSDAEADLAAQKAGPVDVAALIRGGG